MVFFGAQQVNKLVKQRVLIALCFCYSSDCLKSQNLSVCLVITFIFYKYVLTLAIKSGSWHQQYNILFLSRLSSPTNA